MTQRPNEPAPEERHGWRFSGAGTVGRLIVVTDRRQVAEAGHDLADVVATAVEAGARTVLLREKDLPRVERAVLAKAIAELLSAVDGVLLVASEVNLARSVGAAGVHMAAADPVPDLGGGPPTPTLGATPEPALEKRRPWRSSGAGWVLLTFSPPLVGLQVDLWEQVRDGGGGGTSASGRRGRAGPRPLRQRWGPGRSRPPP
jgi:hypothetical protein